MIKNIKIKILKKGDVKNMKLSKEQLVEELEVIEGDLLTAYLMSPVGMKGSKTSDKVKLSKDRLHQIIKILKDEMEGEE